MYGFNLEWQKMFLVQNLSVQSDLQSDHNEYQHFQCEKKSIPFTLGYCHPKNGTKGNDYRTTTFFTCVPQCTKYVPDGKEALFCTFCPVMYLYFLNDIF